MHYHTIKLDLSSEKLTTPLGVWRSHLSNHDNFRNIYTVMNKLNYNL